MLRSPASSGGLASPPEQGVVDQHSLIDASTRSPCLGLRVSEVCEGRCEGRSPPRLELGDEVPSEEALAVECNTLVQILRKGDNDDITPPSGAMAVASWQLDEDGVGEPSTESQTLDEEEDWNFDFLLRKSDDDEDDEGDFDDDEHDTPDGDWYDNEDDASNGDGQGRASAVEFAQASVDSAREAMAWAGRVGYPIMLKTSDAGSKGVRKVQCAEQMESMYQEVTGAVKGAPVILLRLSSDKPSALGNPMKMTDASSPLPNCAATRGMAQAELYSVQAKGATNQLTSLQSPFLTSQTSDLARMQSPLTTHVSGPATRALGVGAGTSSGRKKNTSEYWEHEHRKQANLCHPDFVCNCSHAKSRGRSSCLKQFSPEQLMDFHKEAFGVYIGRDPTKADVGPSALGVRIHRVMWPLREPLKPDGTQDEDGKSWKIGII